MNHDLPYIFEWLSQQEITYFTMMSEKRVYSAWEDIIKEWDKSDDRAYIIEKWSVNIYRSWNMVATLWKWELFWEIALIVNEPRTATVTAAEETEVLVLSKDEFLVLYQNSWNYQLIKDKILERIKSNFYSNKK